ncbi:MAG: response regulator [Candidatus Muiribacteriota bacterium]
MNIIVVDDDKSLTKIIKTFLEKNGFSVDVYNNPKIFFNKFSKVKSPDLIIMDLMMPDSDGLTNLKKIKEMQNKKEIPVIIMSAKNYKSTILSCLSAGAVDFIPKPFTLELLKDKINTFAK